METANEVLSGYQIDAGLAANGRVHLCEQRGGDLNHGYPAHENGREKSGNVGQDAAAHRDNDTRAVAALLNQLLGERLYLREPFACLASRKTNYFMREAA